MDFEEILSKVGGFGHFQKLAVLLLGVSALMRSSHVYVQLFIANEPPHHCRVWKEEDCAGWNVTTTECDSLKKQLSIPSAGQTTDNETLFEQCVQYNVTGLSLETAVESYDPAVNQLEVIPCEDGWVFSEGAIYPSSVIADFELVCGSAYLMEVAQSVFFAGSLVCGPLFGLMADIAGRRNTILLCLALTIVFGIALAFSTNLLMYMLLRFLTAAVMRGFGTTGFVLCTEAVIPSKRLLVSNALYVWWGIGYLALAILAKVLTQWRILLVVIAAPYIPIFVFIWFLIPESPRWLISKRKKEEAKQILQKMAKMNGRRLSEDSISIGDKTEETNKRTETKGVAKDLMHSPLVLAVFANMCFSCCIQSMVYYGLTFTTSSLGIDPYVSFVLSGFMEIPAFLVCAFVGERMGRKRTNFGAMIMSGLCCCATAVIPLGIWRLIVSMTGKFCISMSLSVLFTWNGEIAPTSLRSSAMSVFAVASQMGGVLTPLILILEEPIPILLIGGLAVSASLFSLCLPETKGKPLPSTIQDTEELFGRKVQVNDEGSGQSPSTATKDVRRGNYTPLSMQEEDRARNENGRRTPTTEKDGKAGTYSPLSVQE